MKFRIFLLKTIHHNDKINSKEVIEMGNIEDELRNIIIEKFGSVKEFSNIVKIPYTTIDSILKRGVEKSNVKNLNKITGKLGIDMPALLKGRIELVKFRDTIDELTLQEQQDLEKYIEFLKSQRKKED
nr:MAG TPA: repressor protein [Caudoviricetes sp.]